MCLCNEQCEYTFGGCVCHVRVGHLLILILWETSNVNIVNDGAMFDEDSTSRKTMPLRSSSRFHIRLLSPCHIDDAPVIMALANLLVPDCFLVQLFTQAKFSLEKAFGESLYLIFLVPVVAVLLVDV